MHVTYTDIIKTHVKYNVIQVTALLGSLSQAFCSFSATPKLPTQLPAACPALPFADFYNTKATNTAQLLCIKL